MSETPETSSETPWPGLAGDLDQCFTTAMAALSFSADNLAQFNTWIHAHVGLPVTMTKMDLGMIGMRLGTMADPNRMPGQ